MFGTHDLPLFILSGILLNLTPGQDTMYILGRGIWQGRTAAITSALGISSGTVVHTLAAAFGLSAILAASTTAFTIVKWIGGGYLIYLGLRILLSHSALSNPTHRREASLRSIYRQGMLTNLLNPKVSLFFLAFLPQFVDPAIPHRVLTFLFLGGCFLLSGTLWCLVLACAAGSISSTLKKWRTITHVTERLTGGLFILLGIRLATSKR